MARKKSAIFTPDGVVARRVPAIKGVRPAGSSLLVEMLNSDEILNTDFYVGDADIGGPPQAYIVAVGPGLKDKIDNGENIWLNVGDRVLLQGTFVPVPNWDNHHRERGLVEFHNIKAIIEE